jgi:hypothetical protein
VSAARKWMVVALVAVVAGSFAVSASSTLHMGGANGMHGVPQLALVLVLEVAAITGTAIYVATKVRRVRIKAAVVVVGATAVALVGGVSTYSLLGLVAPLLMVVVVELIADFWHVATDQSKTTTAEQDNQDNPTVEMPRVDGTTVPVEVDFEPHVALSGGFGGLKSVGWTVDQIVADLQGTDPAQRGLQRHIRDHYKVGPSKANKVLDALRMEVAS